MARPREGDPPPVVELRVLPSGARAYVGRGVNIDEALARLLDEVDRQQAEVAYDAVRVRELVDRHGQA